MLRLWGNRRSGTCDGASRRDFLQVGTLGLSGLALGDVLRQRAQAAATPVNDRAVIVYWLDGGPTHMETYDPKPDAPAEFRGPLGSIETKVPGMRLGELLVEHAKVAEHINLVRSMHHNNGDHFAAAHWMLTGFHGSNAANLDPQYPGAGAIIAKMRGANRPNMPAYVSVPYSATVGLRPGYNSGAFLGVPYNPFDAGGDPNRPDYKVPNLNLPGDLTQARLDDRRGLLSNLDRYRREVDQSGLMSGLDSFNRQAFEMVTGEAARQAFDISREDPRTRDWYGSHMVSKL